MTLARPQIRTAVSVTLAILSLLAVICRIWAVGVNSYYEDRVLPHVSYGILQLGGLTKKEALTKLADWQASWWNQYLRYQALDEDGRVLANVEFLPVVVAQGSEQSHELVWYDTQTMLDQALSAGKSTNRLRRAFNITLSFFQPIQLTPVVDLEDAALRQVLRAKLQGYETDPQDASFEWVSAYQAPKIISEQLGNTFDYDEALVATSRQLQRMRNDVITVHRMKRTPLVDSAQARKSLEQLVEIKKTFPVVWRYEDATTKQDYVWQWQWLEAYRAVQPIYQPLTGQIRLQLMPEKLAASWAKIETRININPVDARFEVDEDKRVKQFMPSQAGRKLNREQNLAQLNDRLLAATTWDTEAHELALAVDVIEPQFSTEDVNDLGITEVLGVGYSNFGGSPKNRVHNIGVGVKKLHGLLIPPNEEFSLLKALGPFTEAGGYLPELVIKGDKIEPELGGGLCQIGSTTFRATMNAGLKILERRNHSLVVRYYNDPRNGNPGTDATIYEGSPDFKFVNDTGHHILIMTAMNRATGDLTFTLWGTNDGRKATYSEPVVTKWIPAGETKRIASEDLKPGEEKCQASHPGAIASFVYTVERPDGQKEETTYVSNYRPLPQICLYGKDEVDPLADPLADPATIVSQDPLVEPAAPLS